MTMELWPSKPIAKFDTTLGPMLMFFLTGAGEEGLLEELGRPTEQVEPQTYARALLRQVCCRETDSVGEDGKPPLPSLTIEEVHSLGPDEVETFAELYLQENSDWLGGGVSNGTKPDIENDVSTPPVEPNTTEEGSRREGEAAVEYLHRIVELAARREALLLKRLVGPIAAGVNFSSARLKEIAGEALAVQSSRLLDGAVGRVAGVHERALALGASTALMDSIANGAVGRTKDLTRMLEPFAAASKATAAITRQMELIEPMTRLADQAKHIEAILGPAASAFKDPMTPATRNIMESMARAGLDQAKHIERMAGFSSALGSRPSAVSASVMETLRQGQALSEFATRAAERIPLSEPVRPSTSIGELVRLEAENKWAPFHFLGDKLDRQSEQTSDLKATLSQLANFAVQTNETQTLMAAETKRAAEDSRASGKRNLIINVCVLLVALGSLIVSVLALVRPSSGPTAAIVAEGKAVGPSENVLDSAQEHLGITVSQSPVASSHRIGEEGSSSDERPNPADVLAAPQSSSPGSHLRSIAAQGDATASIGQYLGRLRAELSIALVQVGVLFDTASPATAPTTYDKELKPPTVKHE